MKIHSLIHYIFSTTSIPRSEIKEKFCDESAKDKAGIEGK